jgi:hypothetical protein
LSNHATKDYRRNACEIYGLTNHITFDCKRCIPLNVGPELCAAQVEDPSFFTLKNVSILEWLRKELVPMSYLLLVVLSILSKLSWSL